MKELQQWLAAARGAIVTCQNRDLFQKQIEAQEGRLLKMYFPTLTMLRLTNGEYR